MSSWCVLVRTGKYLGGGESSEMEGGRRKGRRKAGGKRQGLLGLFVSTADFCNTVPNSIFWLSAHRLNLTFEFQISQEPVFLCLPVNHLEVVW